MSYNTIGTQIVKRGPLYERCVSQQILNKQLEFAERIKALRSEYIQADEIEPIEVISDEGIKRKRRVPKVSGDPFLFDGVISTCPTIEFVKRAVVSYFGITMRDLEGYSRTPELCEARHTAFWLCYKFTAKSFPEIGRRCGGRDHTTVLHGYRRIEKIINSNGQPYTVRSKNGQMRLRTASDKERSKFADITNEMRLAFNQCGVMDVFFWGS